MAILPDVTRYTDLISYLPTGSFYESLGTILPYRWGATEIRLETANAGAKYGLYVNDKYTGTYISDTQGNVVFSTKLAKGDNEFKLVQLATGTEHITWVTVREYALWLAAYADILENIDLDINRVYNSLFVNQVEALDAEDRFGTEVDTYRNTGISLMDYRRQLHELRLGYRNWGSRYRGLEHAVADFTQVTPFGYQRRKWGPNWVLDQSMLKNHRFKYRGHTVSWAGAGIAGVTLSEVEPDVVQGAAHVLSVVVVGPTEKYLTWAPGGVVGPQVAAQDGQLFLPGPVSPVSAFVLGLIGVYSIVGGTNDYVYLNLDGKGSIAIQLTTGLPNPSVANVATDINTALAADIRYGAGYAAAASSYNSKLLIEAQAGGSVLVEDGAQNAAVELFGIPAGSLTFDPNPGAGVYSRRIPTLIANVGAASITVNTVASPATLIWVGPGGVPGASTNIDGDAEYTVTDMMGNIIVVYIVEDDLPAAAVTVSNFTIGYQLEKFQVEQHQGMHVLVDTSLLPGVGGNDNVRVEDDATLGDPETPNDWFIPVPSPPIGVNAIFSYSDVTTSRQDILDPAPAYNWNITASGVVSPQVAVHSSVHLTPMPRPGPRGSCFPQRSPGLFYDYEGYTARFSCWVRNNFGLPLTAVVNFSFDGGITWVGSAPQVVVMDVGGSKYEAKCQISYEHIIPAEVVDNRVFVNIEFSTAFTNVDVDIDSPRVDIQHISSAYLNNVTIPRSRHRQYFGELLWVWSADELTLNELEYIGVQHKKPNRRNPFAGVELLTVSSGTSAGVGTVTYKYNSVGDVRELKWDAYGTSWGVGLGWNVLSADGSYTLTATDGSSITVFVTYALTPQPAGSPPAIEKMASITITDTTVNPGHTRKISPAQSSIDVFDVTEYDATGEAINLKGVVKEGDFAACVKSNLSVQTSDPFRFSYVWPTTGIVEGELLTVDSITYLADLEYDSDQDIDNSVLYIDGLPLFNIDPATGLWAWRFTAVNQVEIRPAYFAATSVYTLDYNLLYQIETDILDLGMAYQDYAWWVDYYLWDRMDAVQGEYDAERPIAFNAVNGRAYLIQESNMDMSEASLWVQNAAEQNEVSQRHWRFLDATTVELDLSQLVADSQYILIHKERRVYETSKLITTFEHKSGLSPMLCSGAAWNMVERNENVTVSDGQRYHQMRLTVSGIRSVQDFKIRSMVLKGLHMYGVNANVPGLTS